MTIPAFYRIRVVKIEYRIRPYGTGLMSVAVIYKATSHSLAFKSLAVALLPYFERLFIQDIFLSTREYIL